MGPPARPRLGAPSPGGSRATTPPPAANPDAGDTIYEAGGALAAGADARPAPIAAASIAHAIKRSPWHCEPFNDRTHRAPPPTPHEHASAAGRARAPGSFQKNEKRKRNISDKFSRESATSFS